MNTDPDPKMTEYLRTVAEAQEAAKRKSIEDARGPGNRATRRKAQALLRRQAKALSKLHILRGGELPQTALTQLLILRLAYRALKLGRLTQRQARGLGCRV